MIVLVIDALIDGDRLLDNEYELLLETEVDNDTDGDVVPLADWLDDVEWVGESELLLEAVVEML